MENGDVKLVYCIKINYEMQEIECRKLQGGTDYWKMVKCFYWYCRSVNLEFYYKAIFGQNQTELRVFASNICNVNQRHQSGFKHKNFHSQTNTT